VMVAIVPQLCPSTAADDSTAPSEPIRAGRFAIHRVFKYLELIVEIGMMAMDSPDADGRARFAADVLVAYLRRNTVPASELAALVRELREAFGDDAGASNKAQTPLPVADGSIRGRGVTEIGESGRTADAAVPDAEGKPSGGSVAVRAPAVKVSESVHDDYLVSLEDGKHYRSLRRHLMAKYGMTPDDYRVKWGLPPDYPMVAPSYARERSEVARRSGLGRGAVKKGASKQRQS